MPARMERRRNSGSVAGFAFCGALIAALLWIGIWGPFSAVLQEGHSAETQRLLDAFAQPLAEALAQGDDLAKIDQLHRLQNVPGVVSATIETEPPRRAHDAAILIWKGKTVGELKVHLTQARWRRLRYSGVERLWTLAVLLSLSGAFAGWRLKRRQRKFSERLQRTFKQIRAYHHSSLKRNQQKLEQGFLLWIRQAIAFYPEGLILLDGRQRLVAFNHPAGNALQLDAEILGHHWLDLKPSSEWASALRRSMECPGKTINGPYSDIALMTLLKEGEAPDSTWIICKTQRRSVSWTLL